MQYTERGSIVRMPSSALPVSREHLRPGDRICAAVSGGADSVALLLALYAANRQPREGLGAVLSAVHVHHGLRGEEADADAAFVAELCGRLEVPLHLLKVDVPAHIEQTGETLEEAARNLRYAAFHDLLASGQTDAVLTAHTLDDQAETVLMKLLRGAWTDGLSGIHPIVLPTKEKPGRIIRPLLATRRAEIESYLRAVNQPWREDSSNADTHHTRNRIRHELMPALRTYNPGIDQALANMAELAREEESRWQAELARLLSQILLPGKPVRGGGRAVATAPGANSLAIEIERLRGFDPALRRRVLRAAARQLGARLSFEETARILALCGLQPHPTVTTRIGATVQLSQYLRAERSIRELRLFREVR
jgi:tRNA(Ile)-lysidine synthase